MSERARTSGLWAAGIAAAAMITQQVAGKAMRDALFLSAFGISALPIMLIVSALFSIGTGLLFANLLRIWEPRRAVPGAFAVSAIMQILEWWLSTVSIAATAVLVYLHMAAVGSALISGFWSVLNENFDPHSGRREFARITIGGTVGGLLGGILASALPSFMATTSILPVLAAFHVACAWIVYVLGRSRRSTETFERGNPSEIRSRYEALRKSEYLRQIALLVLLGTVGAACLDYVFKVQAAALERSAPWCCRDWQRQRSRGAARVFYGVHSFAPDMSCSIHPCPSAKSGRRSPSLT
jgi:ATP/ADP translocase